MKSWNYQIPNLIFKLTTQGINKSLVWVALGRNLTKSHMIEIENSRQNYKKIPWAKGIVAIGGII
jgi:hypothetical protein